MSLLADLLSRTKKRQSIGDIPPVLEDVLEKKKKRVRIYVIVVIISITILSGFLLTEFVNLYIKKTPDRLLTPPVVANKEPELLLSPPISESKKQTSATDESQIPNPSLRHQPNTIQPQRSMASIPRELPKSSEIKGEKSERSLEKTIVVQKSEPTVKEIQKKKAQGSKNITLSSGKVGTEKRQGLAISSTNSINNSMDKSHENLEPSSSATKGQTQADLLYRANTCEERGDYGCAIKIYEDLLKIDPGNFRLLNQIAYLYIRLGQPDRAIKYIEKLKELRPDYIPAMINLSVALMMKSEYDKAERILLETLALEPYNRTVLFNIAILYENTGRYEEATEFYRRLISLGDREALEALRRLRLKQPSQEDKEYKDNKE
jgi:tetratricopeptide (TPR) repeat protein